QHVPRVARPLLRHQRIYPRGCYHLRASRRPSHSAARAPRATARRTDFHFGAADATRVRARMLMAARSEAALLPGQLVRSASPSTGRPPHRALSPASASTAPMPINDFLHCVRADWKDILQAILAKAKALGPRAVLAFDLDSTLFDNRPRQA